MLSVANIRSLEEGISSVAIPMPLTDNFRCPSGASVFDAIWRSVVNVPGSKRIKSARKVIADEISGSRFPLYGVHCLGSD